MGQVSQRDCPPSERQRCNSNDCKQEEKSSLKGDRKKFRERNREIEREKKTSVILRTVFLNINCFSTSQRKELNKNLSFLVIFLLSIVILANPIFFNYQVVVLRNQSVGLNYPSLQISCIELLSQPTLSGLGLVLRSTPYNYHDLNDLESQMGYYEE